LKFLRRQLKFLRQKVYQKLKLLHPKLKLLRQKVHQKLKLLHQKLLRKLKVLVNMEAAIKIL
jgi:hypothetical protein